MSVSERWIAYGMLGLAFMLGSGSLLIFSGFVIFGPFNLVNMGLSKTALLWFDAFLCVAFFVQHSVMIRKLFRQRLVRLIPAIYDNAFYSISSGFVLLVLVIFWQASPDQFASPTGIVRWLFYLVLFLSIIGIIWSVRALGGYDPWGLNPILDHLRHTKTQIMPFTIRGPYRWVRHPLYTCCLLIIWSCPILTFDRLLFNVLWTVWIIIGTKLEERDLITTFGESYRDYQRKVPMLIPNRIYPTV